MAVFIIIGAVGFIILVISGLLGEVHDFAVDHEVSFDHGLEIAHDHDLGSEGGPSPFSFRIVALFATVFGCAGAMARFYNFSYPASSIIGVFAGALIGAIGWKFLCLLYKQQADSTIKSEDIIGSLGQVSTPIPKSGLGLVSLETRGQRRYVVARSKDENPIELGATVKVVEYPGGAVAVVEKD